jgi:AraC family transcriptional regulator
MPESNNSPGRVLRGGEFYSQVTAREKREYVFLSELRQPPSCKVPRHEHELAYITLVLDGCYAETDCCGRAEMHTFSAAFNPVGVSHTGEVGCQGARLFTIELRPKLMKQFDVALPSHPFWRRDAGPLLWPGLRLYSLFKAQVNDDLSAESHVLELVAALGEKGSEQRFPPSWFRRVTQRLHEEFRGPLSITALASDAGVHPVHLARVFRAHARKSAGDYVRDLRVRAACQMLRDREVPLAAVAAECGFADQSHLTRIFKRFVGSTPAQFRQAHLRS